MTARATPTPVPPRPHSPSTAGGANRRSPRPARRGARGSIARPVGHSCRHGPPPHHIKVCITKIDNRKTWGEIERAALRRADDPGTPERFQQEPRAAYNLAGGPERDKEQPMANGSTLSLFEIEDR